MNDFFDSFGKAVNDTAKQAIKVSGEMYEYTKASLNIKFDEVKCDNYFREIGKILYSSYKEDSSAVSGDVRGFCESIDELEESIKEQRKKIAVLKRQKFCTACGHNLAESMTFCPVCGARQDDGAE